MKSSLLVSISVAFLAVASPLGNPTLFTKNHEGLAPLSRRFVLSSRINSPPACAALAQSAALPQVVNTTNSSTVGDTNSSVANSTDSITAPSDSSNSTASSTANSTTMPNPFITSNSTAASTTNSTALSDPLTSNSTAASVANSTALPDPSTSTNSTASATADSTALPVPSANNDTNSVTANNATNSRRNVKRIAQDDLVDVALSWQKLCLVSGGDIFTLDPCVNYAGIDGINALLADADPCAQQDNADAMISFAKSPGVQNQDALITNAIAYRKHPRNAVNIMGIVPSTPYCLTAPLNPELRGVWNDQLDGVDPGVFGSPNIPLMPFGEPGTCPFSFTPDVATCSCVNGTDPSMTANTYSGVSSTNTVTDTSTDTATDTSTDTATDTSTDTATDGSTVTETGANSSDTDISTTDTSTDTATDSNSSSVTVSASSSTTVTASQTSVSVQANITASATPAATAAAPPAVTSVFQPPDISGNVTDPNGR